MTTAADSRRHERQEMNWDARLVAVSFDHETKQWHVTGDYAVRAVNLSAGGIGLAFGEGPDLEEGDPVLVVLHRGGPRLTIFGRIRHCRRVDGTGEDGQAQSGQVAGVRFHGLPESLEQSGRLQELGLAA